MKRTKYKVLKKLNEGWADIDFLQEPKEQIAERKERERTSDRKRKISHLKNRIKSRKKRKVAYNQINEL